MNTIKKIIMMSNDDKNSDYVILKLENKNNNIFGTLKTYGNSYKGNYILGIKLKNKIFKQNVNITSNNYNFLSNEITNLDDVLGCVLIEISNGELKPIVWGNEKKQNYRSNIINSLRQSINNISNSKVTSSKLEQNIKNYTKEYKQDNNSTKVSNVSEHLINEQLSLDELYEEHRNSRQTNHTNYINDQTLISLQKLSKLSAQNKINVCDKVYHPIKQNNAINNITELSQIPIEEKIDYSHIPEIAISSNAYELFESNDKEINETIEKELQKPIQKSSHNFYNMIAEQLEELFDKYPPEDNLNRLIDNSYWVKIDTDIVNKYYVVGIINHNDDIKYICYGVPGQYNQEPPAEIRNYSQWLPSDISDPYTKGYWVMYQDADTGENIYIN